jgi:hypothetical protein
MSVKHTTKIQLTCGKVGELHVNNSGINPSDYAFETGMSIVTISYFNKHGNIHYKTGLVDCILNEEDYREKVANN